MASNVFSKVQQAHNSYGTSFTITLTVIVAYFSWRIWAFAIRPALNPEDSKEMPYTVPFVGHAVDFFRDSESACTRARKYMGNTREPFGITVAGEQFYIITSPQDISDIYSDTKTLTFDEHIRDMVRLIGSSPDGVEKMSTVSDHLHKNLAHAGEDFYRQQFLPGNKLKHFWPEISRLISTQLERKRIFSGEQRARDISLLGWCRDALFGPTLTALFGDALLGVAPNILSELVTFDNQSWKMIYQLPYFLSKEMHTARLSITDSFEAYLKLPKERRSGASWLVQKLETEMRQAGIHEHDMAAFNLSVAWTYGISLLANNHVG